MEIHRPDCSSVADMAKHNKQGFNGMISLDGLRATPFRHGYTRYFMMNNSQVSFQVNFEYWADERTLDTPFWVSIRTKGWKTPSEYLLKIKGLPEHRKVKIKDSYYLAIDAPCNKMEDEVVDDIKGQILAYYELLMAD